MNSSSMFAQPVEQMLIRDLVDRYPAVMPLLAELGLDLCCGGGHLLGTALELHGLPKDDVLSRVEAIITASA